MDKTIYCKAKDECSVRLWLTEWNGWRVTLSIKEGISKTSSHETLGDAITRYDSEIAQHFPDAIGRPR